MKIWQKKRLNIFNAKNKVVFKGTFGAFRALIKK
jgi:hypothetical protein